MGLSVANRVPEENNSGHMLFQSQSSVLDEPLSKLEITSLVLKNIDGGVSVNCNITYPLFRRVSSTRRKSSSFK